MKCDKCDYEAEDQAHLWGHIGAKHVKKLRPIAHGTQRGYQMCLRRNGKACPACRRANTIDKVNRRRIGPSQRTAGEIIQKRADDNAAAKILIAERGTQTSAGAE